MQNEHLITQYSEMATQEREFLLAKLQEVKPKKILTIGIAAGANESLILDFLERNEMLDSTEFYSIDYLTAYCHDDNKTSGFLVAECVPYLQKYWSLYTGGVSANFLEKIGGNIDFCVIDTVHRAPGEALDFLMVLPFLSKNATLVMHDLTYHVLGGGFSTRKGLDCDVSNDFCNICSILFNAWNGQKSYPTPYNFDKSPMFQNIGACILADNQLEDSNLESYFRVLNIPWYYMPSDDDISAIKKLFAKYYGQKYVEYFEKILSYQQLVIKQNNERINSHRTIAKLKNNIGYKIDRSIMHTYKRFYNKLREIGRAHV